MPVPENILAMPGQDDSDEGAEDEGTTTEVDETTDDEGTEDEETEDTGEADPDAGETADGEGDEDDGEEPPKKGNPAAAYHRVKDENKRLKEEMDRLRQAHPAAPPPPPPVPVDDDPEPDPEEDPIANLKWQSRERKRIEQRTQAAIEADRADRRTAELRSRVAEQQASDGADWARRVAHFQSMVADMPHLATQVDRHDDPLAEMIRLTDKYGFQKSANGTGAPKAKTPATPTPDRPKTLARATGGRPAADPDDGDDYSDEQWAKMPDAKRRRLLGG